MKSEKEIDLFSITQQSQHAVLRYESRDHKSGKKHGKMLEKGQTERITSRKGECILVAK